MLHVVTKCAIGLGVVLIHESILMVICTLDIVSTFHLLSLVLTGFTRVAGHVGNGRSKVFAISVTIVAVFLSLIICISTVWLVDSLGSLTLRSNLLEDRISRRLDHMLLLLDAILGPVTTTVVLWIKASHVCK